MSLLSGIVKINLAAADGWNRSETSYGVGHGETEKHIQQTSLECL